MSAEHLNLEQDCACPRTGFAKIVLEDGCACPSVNEAVVAIGNSNPMETEVVANNTIQGVNIRVHIPLP